MNVKLKVHQSYNTVQRREYMQIVQSKIGGILYDRGGKPGSDYPDLEPGPGTRFRLQITERIG